MKKIDLHQDIILSFEANTAWFFDDQYVIDIHGTYAGNFHDYKTSECTVVWAANRPYSLQWDLTNLEKRIITFDLDLLWHRHTIMQQLADQHKLWIITSYADIAYYEKKQTPLSFIHHIEWCDHITSMEDITTLYEAWIRSLWFVWNFNNALAHTHTSQTWWLTTLWKEAVWYMNELGMIIDTAHMNEQSMMDVLQYSQYPIINSHSNIQALFQHSRNVTDEFLDKLVKNNGVIWLSIYAPFISNAWNVSQEIFLEQINYVYNRIWTDHLALWTDFHGIQTNRTVSWINTISALNSLESLLNKEFQQSITEKFFSKNVLRVLKNILSKK